MTTKVKPFFNQYLQLKKLIRQSDHHIQQALINSPKMETLIAEGILTQSFQHLKKNMAEELILI